MNVDDAKAAAAKARNDLAERLDQIEDRLDIPKRAKELGTRATEAYKRDPVPWIVAGAAVAVVAVGLIAWAIFGHDDD